MVSASYLGHVITENRNGLIVTAMATQAGNAAERLAALEMVKRLKRRAHHAGCGQELSGRGLREWAAQGRSDTPRGRVQAEPEVAQLADRSRTQRSRTCDQSEEAKLVEKSFGWMKHDRLRQVKLRGLKRVDWLFRFAAAAHNLLRLSKLIPFPATA